MTPQEWIGACLIMSVFMFSFFYVGFSIIDRLEQIIKIFKELAGDPFPDDEYLGKDLDVAAVADSPTKEKL